MKIIFLDIDGPMIPVKAYMLPGHTGLVAKTFDPCAVGMLNKLIELSGARIVISSTHGKRGYEHCVNLLQSNGVDPKHMHDDWVTPKKMSSLRIHEIQWWLDNHPEVTHYVAIDDESLDTSFIPNSVLCDSYEGFSFRNYLECCLFLDVFTDDERERRTAEYQDTILYLKRREIWRTKRCGEEDQHLTWKFADQLFPVDRDKMIKPRITVK